MRRRRAPQSAVAPVRRRSGGERPRAARCAAACGRSRRRRGEPGAGDLRGRAAGRGRRCGTDGVGGAVQDLDRHRELGVARHHRAELPLERRDLRGVGAQAGGVEQELGAHVGEIAGRRRLRLEDAGDRAPRPAGSQCARGTLRATSGPVRRLARRPVISPRPPRPAWLGAPRRRRPATRLRRVERPGERHRAAEAVADERRPRDAERARARARRSAACAASRRSAPRTGPAGRSRGRAGRRR